jgi:hypothetical protein
MWWRYSKEPRHAEQDPKVMSGQKKVVSGATAQTHLVGENETQGMIIVLQDTIKVTPLWYVYLLGFELSKLLYVIVLQK